MVVICIGPVCIPLWGLLPFFVAFAAKCWEWMKQRLGFASGGGATTRSATAVISAGVASAEAAAARTTMYGSLPAMGRTD